jgi:hypothetical protein
MAQEELRNTESGVQNTVAYLSTVVVVPKYRRGELQNTVGECQNDGGGVSEYGRIVPEYT